MDSLLAVLCAVSLLYHNEILAFLLPRVAKDGEKPLTEDIPDVCPVSSRECSFSIRGDEILVQLEASSVESPLKMKQHSDDLSTGSYTSEESYACESTSSTVLERMLQKHAGKSNVQQQPLHVESKDSSSSTSYSPLGVKKGVKLNSRARVLENLNKPMISIDLASSSAVTKDSQGRNACGSNGDHESVVDMKVAMHTSLKLRRKLLRQAAIGRPHSSSVTSSSSSQCSVQAMKDALEHAESQHSKTLMRPAFSRQASKPNDCVMLASSKTSKGPEGQIDDHGCKAATHPTRTPASVRALEFPALKRRTSIRSILRSGNNNKPDNCGGLLDSSTNHTSTRTVQKCVRINEQPLTVRQARRRSSLGIEFSRPETLTASSSAQPLTVSHARRRSSIGCSILPQQQQLPRQPNPQRRLLSTLGKGDQLILDRMRAVAMRVESKN